ncbi:MAG: Gfo/Idh/MocA family oxidoreductase [Thermofilaceae archaeon]|nr:Gfo/Idh/MocA family oxidoreductase [Thermofilaceae archaeon]MCX8180321.1 Gfo/Idh/MocA family oxidoreductase [Thermofilaceae archaeon]MDW8003856.1 Gfo/Idh/MocA family oxidoreductase [Thermofilaceae archaeon]
MRKISYGVIGCGNVSNNYYLPYIVKNHRLVAVADLLEERAKRSRELWKAERWYSDPNKLLKDPEVEAVVIVTSHESHAELAVKAAEEGKHFIVQKPMALSIREAQEVVKSVEKSGVVAIAEPSDSHLSPLYRVLKELLADVGRHCFSIWHTGHSGPTWSMDFFKEEKGGGVLYDLAVYDVSKLVTLFGEPKRVSALGSIFMKERTVIQPESVTEAIRRDTYGGGVYYFHDIKPKVSVSATAFDNFAGVLEYDGSLAVVLANYVTFTSLQMPPTQIYCTEGVITVHPYEPLITVVTTNGEVKRIGRERIGERKPYYHASIDHLAECIVKGEKPLPSVEWGYRVTKILLALNESAKTGKTVDLS